MDWKRGYEILKEAVENFMADQAMQLGAALAYFSLFSIAPLLIIAIAIAGAVFGPQAAQGEVTQVLTKWLGPASATTIAQLIVNAHKPAPGTIATIFSIAIILFGASGVFSQLRYSLNTIWGVAWKPSLGVWGTLRDRFLSVSAVLGTGFLLIVSLVLNAALSAVGSYFSNLLPGGSWIWQGVNQVVSFCFISAIFMAIFKYLPDTEMDWRDALVGGAFTTLLFTIGKFVLGWYIGKFAGASVYGAASSLVVVLIWVFYSSLIFYFGAEFTQAWAQHHHRDITPGPDAVPLAELQHPGATPAPGQARPRPVGGAPRPGGPAQPR